MARRPRVAPVKAGTAVLVTFLAAILVIAVLDLPDQPGGLTTLVEERLAHSGVTHPVTAVLLNFRAYDTWLELGVLLLALVGLLVIQQARDLTAAPVAPAADAVLVWLVRLLLPVAILAAGYLLWLGTHAPGGAFQAGAVLGAAGVLLRLAGHRSAAALRGLNLRALALSGFAGFLIVAAGVSGAQRALLEYPTDWAGRLILLVELAAAAAVAVTLAALFTGAQPFLPESESGDPATPE